MKRFILFLVFVTCSYLVKAQLVHVNGDMSAGIGASYVQDGFNVLGKYNYLFSNKFGLTAGLVHEKKRFELGNMGLTMLEVDIKYLAYRVGNRVFLKLGAGVFGAFEKSTSIIFEDKQKLSLGESVSLSADIYLNNRFILDINLKQRLHHLSSVGNLSFCSGVGINYKF